MENFQIPEEVSQKRRIANGLRKRARQMDQKADELLRDHIQRQYSDDPLINKAEAIELLWFGSYESLKNWREKVQPLGYLRFENNKIPRSEVLRFRDHYYNGTITKKLKRSPS